MKQIGKHGKVTPFFWVFLMVIAFIGALIYIVRAPTLAVTTDASGKPVPVTASCSIQPTLSAVGNDAIVTATAATPTTVTYVVGGKVYSSAPTFSAGQTVTMVGDLTGYLADKQVATTECGAKAVQFNPYAYANATITIKDDAVTSSNTLTNGGGANNATAAAAGGQRNFPMIVQGTSQKSTSTIFWVIESPANMAANISMISASCGGVPLSAVPIPTGVSAANAGSTRTAFEIPAVVNGASVTCNLQVLNSASGVVKGLFKNTFYAEQTFVDSNGNVQTGIYDSTPNGNNAAKYQDTYTYNFAIA